MNPPQFFAELKRRNIRRLAAAYATTGLVVIVTATMLLAVFEAAAAGLTRLNSRLRP